MIARGFDGEVGITLKTKTCAGMHWGITIRIKAGHVVINYNRQLPETLRMSKGY